MIIASTSHFWAIQLSCTQSCNNFSGATLKSLGLISDTKVSCTLYCVGLCNPVFQDKFKQEAEKPPPDNVSINQSLLLIHPSYCSFLNPWFDVILSNWHVLNDYIVWVWNSWLCVESCLCPEGLLYLWPQSSAESRQCETPWGGGAGSQRSSSVPSGSAWESQAATAGVEIRAYGQNKWDTATTVVGPWQQPCAPQHLLQCVWQTWEKQAGFAGLVPVSSFFPFFPWAGTAQQLCFLFSARKS